MKTHYLISLFLLLAACGLPTGPEVPSDKSISVEEISPFASIAGQWEIAEIVRMDYSLPDTTVSTWEAILSPEMQSSSFMKLRNGVIDLNGNVIFHCDTINNSWNNGETIASYTSRYEFTIIAIDDSTFFMDSSIYIASYRLNNDPWIEKPVERHENYYYSLPFRIKEDSLIIPIIGSYLHMTTDCYDPPYAIRYDVGIFLKTAEAE